MDEKQSGIGNWKHQPQSGRCDLDLKLFFFVSFLLRFSADDDLSVSFDAHAKQAVSYRIVQRYKLYSGYCTVHFMS